MVISVAFRRQLCSIQLTYLKMGGKTSSLKVSPRAHNTLVTIRSCNHHCPIQGEKVAASDIALKLNGHFGYQKVVVHTSKELGSGSYGSVVKATLDRVPCAAKIIH